MNPRRDGLEKLVTALDLYIGELQRMKHTFREILPYPIEPILGEWDRIIKLTEQENPEDLYEFLSVHRSGIGQLQKAFWNSLISVSEQRSQPESLAQVQEYLPDAFNDISLEQFFQHDISHISGDLFWQFRMAGATDSPEDSFVIMKDYRQEVRQFLERFNDEPEFFLGHYIEPFKMLHFMATTELGEKTKKEVFSPQRLVWQTAYTLQYRDISARVGISTRAGNTQRNEIVVDTEDFSLYGNSGLVFSIVYNLAKNAYKKLMDEPDAGNKIYVQLYEAPLGCYVITVADSGSSIDVSVMKEKIREYIQEHGIENTPFPSLKLQRDVSAWRKSEYKVAELTIGDLTDIAFMARMSGVDIDSDNSGFITSGMGLYGVRYLVDKMGGRILYGENFKTGSPIFTVILPKTLPSSFLERTIAEVGSGINWVRYYHSGNPRKVA